MFLILMFGAVSLIALYITITTTKTYSDSNYTNLFILCILRLLYL